MAEWVPQNDFSSVTPASRRRVAYLLPLVEEVIQAIDEYIESHLDGEEATLAVAKRVGESRLRTFSDGRGFDRAKQDLGLLTAITLVDMHGANRVLTLRRDDRRSVSARRNTWPEIGWVGNFTPHRVLPEVPTTERILLDTNIVRNIIHGDKDAIDLEELARVKRKHPVSIGNAAIAELAAALFRGSIPFEDWSTKVMHIDSVLDIDFPVAPGGKELSALWGGHTSTGLDLAETRAHHRATWRLIREARTRTDLEKGVEFVGPTGRRYLIRVDQATYESAFTEEGKRWSEWFERTIKILKEEASQGTEISERFLIQIQKSDLIKDMGFADAEKLDLVVRVLAKRLVQGIKPKDPYKARNSHNEPLDLDLLYGLPLPAWVCTSDTRLLHLARSTGSADASNVMSPRELLDRLRGQA
jgi:hypothetical protein